MNDLTKSAVERKKKMQMSMDAFRKMSGAGGLGAMTDASYNPVGGNDGQSNVGSALVSVMPAGSYIDPTTGQFSETAPAPVVPASTNPFQGYTIYIIVAGALVALYFYQKSKGRSMFDVSGLANDLKKITGIGAGGKKHKSDEGEEE